MPRKPPVADLIRELVTAHGLDRAEEIAHALGAREGRIGLRVPAAKRDGYMAAAKRAGVPLSRWIERACDAALKR